MFRSRLQPLPPQSDDDNTENGESPEDLFGGSLPTLFPDDAPSFHGDPGQRLIYASPRYGPLEIMIPSYPGQEPSGSGNVEEGRKLFAHLLWSAAMVVAEGVENADTDSEDDKDTSMWKVKGESVLELGAGAFLSSFPRFISFWTLADLIVGAALPSVICSLAQASAITATDHPSSPALSSAMPYNTTHNHRPTSTSKHNISIHPHEWGTLTTDPWALSNKGKYTRIIAADCLWMRWQHENLARTMQWFLAPGGKVWVVAGFHTGRAVVAAFFETAAQMGLVPECIYERDLVADAEDGGEIRREWKADREGEGPENRTRWCVVAVLVAS